MYEAIFNPINLGGVELKNRIIFAPTSFGLKQQEYEDKITKIAQGGCGMIIIGDVSVVKGGFSSIYSKKGFEGYKRLCDIAHKYDCKICAQLHKSDSNIKAMIKYIPGVLTKRISMEKLRGLLNEEVSDYISQMPKEKVAEITSAFGDGAVLANKAGFDMVQVHGDRMCGSFSSSLYNKRTDCYGGNIENRARFAVEAVTAIRKQLPNMSIDFKLAVRQENPHYGNAGVLFDELGYFVKALEGAGVTSFHVALANHGELTDTIPPKSHRYFSQEGCFIKFCDEVRKYTELPLCGVGGLTDPDFIELEISSKRIDCAAMSRQLIADSAWPQKVKEDKINEIKRCIRCNKDCLGGIQRHKGVHCIYDKKEEMK